MNEVRSYSLPNICRNSAVLVTILVAQLVTLVMVLVNESDSFLIDLGLASIYVQWICLGSLGVLCLARNRISSMPWVQGFVASLVLCTLVYLVIETGTQLYLGWQWQQEWQWSRFWRYWLIDIIVTLLVLRFFSVVELLNERSRSELQSRIQALHSRIQPHFLFNSLNTIAELAATRPEHAEPAIQSLSRLFWASLSDTSAWHSLEEELRLCRGYLDLEQWRLGDRLRLNWQVNVSDLDRFRVPRLIAQPLIENAVVHGVQPSDTGGDVSVVVTEKKHSVVIRVLNSVTNQDTETRGQGLALQNLKDRLAALYDDGYKLRVYAD